MGLKDKFIYYACKRVFVCVCVCVRERDLACSSGRLKTLFILFSVFLIEWVRVLKRATDD